MKQKNKLTTLSVAILGLVAQKPRTGYDLRKFFATTPLGRFSNSPGAIYPALQRIEKQGWVQGSIDAKKTLRPRRVYRMTRKGMEVLRRHLVQDVLIDDVIWHMDDLMLRFAFMDEITGRASTVQFLRQFLAALEAHLRSLRTYFIEVKDHILPCGRLAMESGIQGYEASAKWTRRAIKELQQESI